MNQKIVIITCVVACAIAVTALLKTSIVAPNNTDTFIVGTAAGYAPFVSIDAQGDYVGFDIEVAKALAQQMGKTLVIKDLGSMPSLFMALEQQSIDAIIWGLSITHDRLQKVNMIRYAGEPTNAYSLIFWKTIPTGIRSIDDMNNRTICVEPASAQDAVLRNYTFITPLPTDKVDDALLNIQYGKADAAFVEPAIAKKFKNKYPEIQLLEVPLAAHDTVMGIGVALKKERAALTEQVQQAVNDLQEIGLLATLQQEWDIS